jgi:hypothetical protein
VHDAIDVVNVEPVMQCCNIGGVLGVELDHRGLCREPSRYGLSQPTSAAEAGQHYVGALLLSERGRPVGNRGLIEDSRHKNGLAIKESH